MTKGDRYALLVITFMICMNIFYATEHKLMFWMYFVLVLWSVWNMRKDDRRNKS